MAKDARLELRVEPGLLARVDAARGDVSRTRFVERVLEAALGLERGGLEAPLAREGRSVDSGGSSPAPVPSAQPRASGSSPREPVRRAELEGRAAARAGRPEKPFRPVPRS